MSWRGAIEADTSDSGQATVEFGVMLLMLMTLVVCALEFGRAWNASTIVTQASREGARVAAVSCSINPGCGASVDTSVTNALTGLNIAAADWTVTPGPYVSGTAVTVHVDYTVTPVSSLVAALIPGGVFTIGSDTTMRLE
jgi:Flp pilus assembly protein TadG